MADKSMEVIEGTKKNAVWYVDRNKLAEETKKGFVAVVPQKVVLESGRAGLYRAEQAHAFGLCTDFRETRQDVAEAYGLPPRTLREDLLEGRQPIAYRVVVRGAVTAALYESLERRIRRVIAARNANFILLQLECHGGDTLEAPPARRFPARLKDNDGQDAVMTVAYVTPQASDVALLIALGYTEIVMDSRASLGNFEAVLASAPTSWMRCATLWRAWPRTRAIPRSCSAACSSRSSRSIASAARRAWPSDA